METEVESMVTVPIQQVSSSVPLLILQSSISHLLNQYLLPVKNHSLQLSPPTSALQQSSSVLEMYYNLPPRTVSPVPVAIVASRAVDPVGSPSSTTNDQDEQSTSTSPTNQEIQSQVTHQGPVPQFMAPDHSSSGPVLHEMMSDHNCSVLAPQRQEMSVENVSSGLVPQGQKVSDYDNSDPVPPRQNVVPTAEKIDSSQQGRFFTTRESKKRDHPLGTSSRKTHPMPKFKQDEQLAADPACKCVCFAAHWFTLLSRKGSLIQHHKKCLPSRKALYGLKQVSRARNEELSNFLMSNRLFLKITPVCARAMRGEALSEYTSQAFVPYNEKRIFSGIALT
ncbi:hypothetical protein Tco_1502094 [Tanacetum coccineum]